MGVVFALAPSLHSFWSYFSTDFQHIGHLPTWGVHLSVSYLCAFENGSSYGDSYIYYCGQESLRRNGVAIIVNKRVQNAVLGCNLKSDRMISICFQSAAVLLTSLVAQMVKRLSTMRETRVQSLGWEDPLEKEMAIHSSTFAWKIPWTEEPGRLQSMGSQSRTRLSDFTSLRWRLG